MIGCLALLPASMCSANFHRPEQTWFQVLLLSPRVSIHCQERHLFHSSCTEFGAWWKARKIHPRLSRKRRCRNDALSSTPCLDRRVLLLPSGIILAFFKAFAIFISAVTSGMVATSKKREEEKKERVLKVRQGQLHERLFHSSDVWGSASLAVEEIHCQVEPFRGTVHFFLFF